MSRAVSAKVWSKINLHIDVHNQDSKSSQFHAYSPISQMTNASRCFTICTTCDTLHHQTLDSDKENLSRKTKTKTKDRQTCNICFVYRWAQQNKSQYIKIVMTKMQMWIADAKHKWNTEHQQEAKWQKHQSLCPSYSDQICMLYWGVWVAHVAMTKNFHSKGVVVWKSLGTNAIE